MVGLSYSEVPMTSRQKSIHDRLVTRLAQHKAMEFEIIQDLQEAEAARVHRSFGHRSLFQYAVNELKLSAPVALSFISVSRKAREVPELKQALANGDLCVSKSSRIVSTLSRENAAELVSLARTSSWRAMEREIAKRNPKAAAPDRIKILSEKIAQLLVTLPIEGVEEFERVMAVEAQRTSKAPSRGEALRACFKAYLDKHDPVRRAERAQERKEKAAFDAAANKNSARTERISEKTGKTAGYGKRIPLTAVERHLVNARDKGRCTYVDEKGHRCSEDRWTDIHHIVSVSQGGGNDLENLTTLCGFHHDLVHQLSLPIDGQIPWLRSPRVPYGKWAS